MRRSGRCPILACALLLSACGRPALGGADVERYAGIYQHGFEVDSFRPCGADAAWWVTGGEELRARYAEVADRPYREVYVVVRGRVSAEGEYGHLGRYEREIEVEELVALEPERSSC